MRRLINLSLCLIAVLGLAGCEKRSEWHQKLTVSVETPDGVKTASSVTAVVMTDTTKMWVPPEGRRVTYKITGEAVVMEVTKGKFLFVLLKDLPNAPSVFLPDVPREEAGPRVATLHETRELTPKQYPLLVTFGDISDPASVKRVAPENLEASFGLGYRLESITMTITDEPVSHSNVERILKPAFFRLWADQFENAFRAVGPFGKLPFAFQLTRDDFITKEHQS